jgi:hypothetical protein
MFEYRCGDEQAGAARGKGPGPREKQRRGSRAYRAGSPEGAKGAFDGGARALQPTVGAAVEAACDTLRSIGAWREQLLTPGTPTMRRSRRRALSGGASLGGEPAGEQPRLQAAGGKRRVRLLVSPEELACGDATPSIKR